MNNNTISIWAEKYRPQSLSDYIGNKDLLEKVKSYIEKKDIPHLLFYGSAGTGKTTLSKLIANGIDCDLLYINASDENNVDNVRTKIKDFAANVGFSALKVVILDEADFLTQNSQAALRNIIETYSASTRFIFTCNYIEKITEPIVSRCQCFEIFPMNKKDIAVHLKKILDLEGVKYTIDDIAYVINNYYPDIRKILNFSQQSLHDNQIKIPEVSTNLTNIKHQIVQLLKDNGTPQEIFGKIRQTIADSGSRNFDELYLSLFDKASEYAPKQESEVILTIAEYSFQNSMVVNKEITFMACIARILQLI